MIMDITKDETLNKMATIGLLDKTEENFIIRKKETKNGIHEINRLTASFETAIKKASRNQISSTIKTIVSKFMSIFLNNLVSKLGI